MFSRTILDFFQNHPELAGMELLTPTREGPDRETVFSHARAVDRRAGSRYPWPHQGARECHRRMRQREKGGAA